MDFMSRTALENIDQKRLINIPENVLCRRISINFRGFNYVAM